MITVGLLGCGNIGHVIAKGQENFRITAVYDSVSARAEAFGKEFGAAPYDDFAAFLQEPTDIVVEAASVAAATTHAESILLAGKDLVIMSVGALADVSFREELIQTAREMKKKIHIPSGAIMGLDNIRVGQISGIDKFVLRTTKNPKSLSREAEEKTCIFSEKPTTVFISTQRTRTLPSLFRSPAAEMWMLSSGWIRMKTGTCMRSSSKGSSARHISASETSRLRTTRRPVILRPFRSCRFCRIWTILW